MKSTPTSRRATRRLAALGTLAAAAFAVTASAAAAASPIPAGGAAIDHASLDWTGDLAMQGPNHGLPNFFSVGLSKGTEATYKGAEGNAAVLLEKEGGAVATWATHTNYSTAAGERQVVRLTEGKGRVEPDGSAEIGWDATFSVNYYGELTPFSIEDPTLTVGADGTGELTATLVGCKGSKGGGGCVPFAPVPDVQVATFAGVAINSLGEVTIDPDWAEVEVDTGSGPPQDRTAADWGAWPQSFVDFQLETGLSSFFYSAGANSAEKVPLPFVVDFTPPVAVAGASLDWIGNQLMQSSLHGFKSYFSAGLSDGREGSYKGAEGNAAIYLEGVKKIATWATRESYGPAAGERQLVHLSGGVGEFQQFGPAEVEWDGAFSVNFYGGLVPFSIEDPLLVVDEDGTGELKATLVGCEATMADPTRCTSFAAASEVQVATFSGVEIDSEELVVDPDYAEVTITEPAGAVPQVRSGSDWGAWPQSFVDFQGETGLSSYWYSSGSEDAAKPPLPFAVDFAGRELEIVPDEKALPPSDPGTPPGDAGSKPADTVPPASAKPVIHRPAKLRLGKKTVTLTKGRVVRVATISCPAVGTSCRTVVPSRVVGKVGGKRYVLTALAPKRIAAGRSAALEVRLPKQAKRALHMKALHGKKLAVRIRVGLVANGVATKHVVKVKIAGRH